MKLFRLLLVSSVLFWFSNCEKESFTNEMAPIQPANSISKTYTLGAAPIKLYLTVSNKAISLIDYLYVTVRVESDPDFKISPPYLSSEVYDPLILTESPRYQSGWSQNNQYIYHEWTYKLEPFSSGEFVLKAFNLHFRKHSEKAEQPDEWPLYTISTTPVPYQVKPSDIASTGQIKEIKGPITPGFNYYPLLLVILGLLLSLSAGYYLLKRKNSARHTRSTALETHDYYLETMDALDKLEKQDLITQAKYEELHLQLSIILRAYFENFFSIPAEELTTEEFIKDISRSNRFSLEQQHVLDQFFRLTDLVKFATFNPGDSHSIAAMESVRSFVQSTGKSNDI
ncbi:MAG: LPXTG cell wall anchor domain-containing protein [Proteobacteria bacterium]|nr:LPXTG cell wall anchor domain-containing protein [Pseudomonadota bacterium]